jgi:hypothetical protein
MASLEESSPVAASPTPEPGVPARRPPRMMKRARRWLSARLIALAAVVLRRCYMADMTHVRITSRED